MSHQDRTRQEKDSMVKGKGTVSTFSSEKVQKILNVSTHVLRHTTLCHPLTRSTSDILLLLLIFFERERERERDEDSILVVIFSQKMTDSPGREQDRKREPRKTDQEKKRQPMDDQETFQKRAVASK